MEGESAVEKEVKRHVTQILCILCAIALWLYVTYTEDPEMQVWMRDIPVSYTGTEDLTARGITFVSKEEPEEINVKIAGRKSVLRRLLETDVRANVDYAAITGAGTHHLPISITLLQNDLRVSKVSVSSVKCQTDVLVTVEKTVGITSSGAEPLGIRDFAASPSTVRVSGPKGVLEHLKAGVYVDLTGGDAANSYTVSLSDQTGKPFSSDTVTIENDAVTISATRALPVKIEAANPPEGTEFTEVKCNPETADVRGALPALLESEAVHGAYETWVDFSSSPAKSGQVPLVYPDDVEPLGVSYASAEFHF